MDSSFSPGQRWVSNAEPELGLGLVEDRGDREVTLTFPAIGEQRTYSINNAPLTRVTYEIGDRIRHKSGYALLVVDRELHAGQMFYQASVEGMEPVVVPERDLDSFFQLRKASDRLLTGQLDRNRLFELRTESLLHHHRHRSNSVLGLLGARAQLLPHQLYIAHEVARRHAPRVLLADEVGLGKTIEAGLIMHQLLVSGRARRVLIIVPETLVHQWLVEMLRRFNLLFTVMDEERFDALADPGEEEPDNRINPFESTQLVLTTLPWIEEPDKAEALHAADWDLMIVDEAHHLSWSEDGASRQFDQVSELAEIIPSVLLLTGTPEQLGVDGHFARLRILDPARYHNLDAFLAEESGYEVIGDIVEQLADPLTVVDDELAVRVGMHLGEEWTEELLTGADDPDSPMRNLVMDQLLDRHGTGRVLFRNVRESIGGFPARHYHTHELEMPDELAGRLETANILEQLRPEKLLGEQWLKLDPRVAWLENWLKAHRAYRTLLICANSMTARLLEEHLRTRCGVRSGVFHEGMSMLARDRAAAYFAQTDEPAQILVCSEIGSEGRNFQFASQLILFDLPLNPDLLEQRIGRLDRIGQLHAIDIHVPFYTGSPTERLARWYHGALDAFERSTPVAARVMDELRDELLAQLRTGDDAGLESLIERGRALHADALETHQRGRNRLLDLNSCRPHRADEIVANVAASAREAELFAFMQKVFDAFGIEHEQNPDESLVLRPGEHMLADNFPSLPEDGATATFRRHHALQREDLLFLTWEHPMVTGAMDLLLGTELGSASLCTIKLPPLAPSSLLLECIFVLRTQAPPSLQVQRFINGAAVRLLIDEHGRDLGSRVTRTRLNGLARGVPTAMAQDVIKHARKRIDALLDHAHELASERGAPLVNAAVAKVEEAQSAELERLAALAEFNPNIREAELHAVVRETDLLIDHMERVELELDAVRLVVVT